MIVFGLSLFMFAAWSALQCRSPYEFSQDYMVAGHLRACKSSSVLARNVHLTSLYLVLQTEIC